MSENENRAVPENGENDVTREIDTVLSAKRKVAEETPRRTPARPSSAAPGERQATPSSQIRRTAPEGQIRRTANDPAARPAPQAQNHIQPARPQPAPQQGQTPRAPQGQAHAPQTQNHAQPARPQPAPQQGQTPHTPQEQALHAPQGQPVRAPQAAPQTPAEPAQRKEAAPVRPVSGRKLRTEKPADATRVTDVSKSIRQEAVDPKKEEKRKKREEADNGGTIVSSLLRTVIYLVSVTVIAVVLSIFIINVGNDVFAFVKSNDAIEVTIPEGATRSDIADILYDNGVINYKTAFKIYGSLKHIEENFVAGDYTVTPMMNYKDLYNAFKPKPVSGTTWITIPEGYTIDEIIDLMLKNNIGGTKQDYVDVINKGDFSEFWFVNELEENGYSEDRYYRLEGYLFPDTYEFYNASSAYTVVRKMLKRFDEIYTDKLKTRAAELGMTTDQVVILASMIEREAGFSYDFRNVSSVFHNRLRNSATFPYLASDATAVYAIQHDTGERPKSVTSEMMQYESPYNTYTNPGLPPGAIANPGMNALKYALYPAETYYYYFVSLPNGETLFATNQWDHEQNVARLRSMQG
ncbi:MAG: endolytic transglycosylase MltG [Clostridia bacterium]|nr:endolytic transglycosylase MltG [Clostridia bacterium]